MTDTSRRRQAVTPHDLAQWFADARRSLDSGRPLTVDHLMALASAPERGRRVPTTWWLEELCRVAKRKIQDAYPGAHASTSEVRAWLDRQDDFDDQISGLADAHAEARARAAEAAGDQRRSREMSARNRRAEAADAPRLQSPNRTVEASATAVRGTHAG